MCQTTGKPCHGLDKNVAERFMQQEVQGRVGRIIKLGHPRRFDRQADIAFGQGVGGERFVLRPQWTVTRHDDAPKGGA